MMNNAIANSVLCGIGNSEENTLSEYAKNAGKSMVGNIAGSKAGNAFCVVTFSNLMHIETACPIFCFLLKTWGIYVALVFLGIGIYNYFTIPKN